uniref:Uncharacterized protein n=1 Tax=Pithovirus LCPAC404 TaxID=2506597 RepID=A0A481ZCI1_9VIRU|nr:MAG: uncharacterized protein LCPAC404_01910 [Pithovirus LCPAC404]
MFLEVSVTIIDPKSRHLDLGKLCEKFPGGGSFGDWKNKEGQLESLASWTACFAGYYNKLCSKHELSYRTRTGEINQFRDSDLLITDPFSATFYMMIVLKDIPEAVTFMNAKVKGTSDEPVSVLFPYVDDDTAAVLIELEPIWKEFSDFSNANNLSDLSLSNFSDILFPDIDPTVKVIMTELIRMYENNITSTREEMFERLNLDVPPQVNSDSEPSSPGIQQLLEQLQSFTQQTDETDPSLLLIEKENNIPTLKETFEKMSEKLNLDVPPQTNTVSESGITALTQMFEQLISSSSTQQTDETDSS